MPNFKDRKPANAGSRSFFPVKSFLILVTVCVVFLAWYATRLVVAVVPEEGDSFCFTAPPGEEWHISLTHSVEKTEWNDYFTVNAVNDMTMTHTRFESMGWGYPYSPSEGKLTMTEDGKFDLTMNRPYKEVALRISEQAMPQLVHGSQRYDLIKMYGQGTALMIKAHYRYSYWYEKYF